MGILQNLYNAYNGIDSRLPKVPYSGMLSAGQTTKEPASPVTTHKNYKETATRNIAVSNLKNTFSVKPKTIGSTM